MQTAAFYTVQGDEHKPGKCRIEYGNAPVIGIKPAFVRRIEQPKAGQGNSEVFGGFDGRNRRNVFENIQPEEKRQKEEIKDDAFNRGKCCQRQRKTKQAQIAVVAFFEPAEVQRNGVYAEQRHQRVVVGAADEKVILHNRVGKKNKTAEQCQVDIELPAQAVCQGYGRQDAEPGGKECPAEENGVAQVAEMQKRNGIYSPENVHRPGPMQNFSERIVAFGERLFPERRGGKPMPDAQGAHIAVRIVIGVVPVRSVGADKRGNGSGGDYQVQPVFDKSGQLFDGAPVAQVGGFGWGAG